MSWSFRYTGDAKAVADKIDADQGYFPDEAKRLVRAMLTAMEAQRTRSSYPLPEKYLVSSDGHFDAGNGGHMSLRVDRVEIVLDGQQDNSPQRPAEP
jgi:hypothetical protein